MTDVDATAAMADAALTRWPATAGMTGLRPGGARSLLCRASTGVGEVAAGDDLAALLAARGRRCATATSSWSPARS